MTWIIKATDLGHHRLATLASPLRYDWYSGGGFVRSHLVVRYRGRVLGVLRARAA